MEVALVLVYYEYFPVLIKYCRWAPQPTTQFYKLEVVKRGDICGGRSEWDPGIARNIPVVLREISLPVSIALSTLYEGKFADIEPFKVS